MRKKREVKTPRQARTFNDICAMPRDNVSYRGWCVLTDGVTVSIVRQRVGEEATEQVSVPRGIFDAFADWYMTGTWPPKPRQRKA